MTSIVDSKAHFLKRCNDMGLSARALASLGANGLDTLGTMAFGVGQPGVPETETDDAFSSFARGQLGGLASVADMAILKRLLFESHCMALAQLCEQVRNPEVSEIRKLPAIEGEARMAALKARLVGVDHQPEPLHALIDIFSRQWEARQPEYVSLERCTSREWEVTHSKSSAQISIDQDKLLVREEKKFPGQPAQSSELQVLEAQALQWPALI